MPIRMSLRPTIARVVAARRPQYGDDHGDPSRRKQRRRSCRIRSWLRIYIHRGRSQCVILFQASGKPHDYVYRHYRRLDDSECDFQESTGCGDVCGRRIDGSVRPTPSIAPPSGACGGGSSPAPTPLDFTVTAPGLTVAAFNDTGNASGSPFAVDVSCANGNTGLPVFWYARP